MSAPALSIGLAAADRFVDAAGADARWCGAMITRFGIGAGGQRLLELLEEELDRHEMVDADVVLHPPRQQLVLDLDRRKPAASASAMVRWMCTGSPQPPPASSTIGSLQTARMSTATSTISGSVRLASVTHLTQPSEPPRR